MPPHNRPSSSRLSTATTPAHVKSRQFSHLNSQLAQLQAHLADLDNHVRITAIQAEAMKKLGAQHASMYFPSATYSILRSNVLMVVLWRLRGLLGIRMRLLGRIEFTMEWMDVFMLDVDTVVGMEYPVYQALKITFFSPRDSKSVMRILGILDVLGYNSSRP
jgi:hypothetical protein